MPHETSFPAYRLRNTLDIFLTPFFYFVLPWKHIIMHSYVKELNTSVLMNYQQPRFLLPPFSPDAFILPSHFLE
jgi:hypothetical protein